MNKNDEIMFDKREDLAEDHPFLRTELGQYAFQLGFDAAVESMVERACEWLEKNVRATTGTDNFALAESFKKAMNKSDMENVSYTVDEYVLKYDHIDFGGENTDRFDSFEEAVKRLKRLELKGCFNFILYHNTKEVFNISKILES